MSEKTSFDILREPNHIFIDEDYTFSELATYLLTWGVEIALTFTIAIVYLRG
ncbi:MAG: hypothetical protein WAU47_07295 [Desulfobaccales bacterium]